MKIFHVVNVLLASFPSYPMHVRNAMRPCDTAADTQQKKNAHVLVDDDDNTTTKTVLGPGLCVLLFRHVIRKKECL
jgi:hypothetical protein